MMNSPTAENTEKILVDTAWLSQHGEDPSLVLLDAGMAPPGVNVAEQQAIKTIPGARRFDIDGEFSDLTAPFPHTMLQEQDFVQRARALGINQTSTVVVFDSAGMFSAPRAWWMFKALGHTQTFILDGGLPAWCAAGLPTSDHYQSARVEGNFIGRLKKGCLVSMADVKNAQHDGATAIVDARSADRFYSRVDEPRPGLRRGHIHGSLNLPFDTVLRNGCYLSRDQLQQHFDRLGLSPDQKIIFSCGSGVTACIDAVAALLCGYTRVCVYDGSWCEWATQQPEGS